MLRSYQIYYTFPQNLFFLDKPLFCLFVCFSVDNLNLPINTHLDILELRPGVLRAA